MAKVKNKTESHVDLSIEGERYRIAPGKTVDVTPRAALLLDVYDGLEVQGDRAKVIRDQDVPSTEGETRRTGGRQHVSNDPRTHKAGTPVTVTGDTGSTTPEAGVQGVSGAEAASGEPNEVRGTEEEGGNGDDDTAPTDPDPEWIAQLKGAELDESLRANDLPTSGKVADKRARLAEHVTALEAARTTPTVGGPVPPAA